MLRIFAAAILVASSLASPPLLVVTIPIGIIWATAAAERRRKCEHAAAAIACALETRERTRAERARDRTLQRW